MLSLRSLAHAAAILALAVVGLTLGLWLRDPHAGGLVFLLVVVAVVAVLLWWLYRPGGIAWAPQLSSAPVPAEDDRARPASVEPEPRVAPESDTEPATAAPTTSQRPPGVPRIGVPTGRRLAAALVLGAIALAAIAFLAWPESRPAAKTARPASAPAAQRPQPQARAKPAPKPPAVRRPAPRPRPRHAAPARASARSLGSATLMRGSQGADVKLLQELLKVPASGKYDAKTEAAVRSFQGKHQLPGTGVAAALTHKALKKAFP